MKSTSFNYLNFLRPNIFLKSIDNININTLKKLGVKYVFCDLDNTLVPHFTRMPNSNCIKFINNLKENGIKVIIVSNNSKKRVETFCNLIDVDDFIYKANKPLIYKIKKILKKYNIEPEDVIMIGDQFITDIVVANRMNFKSILVLPIVDSVEQKFNNIIVAALEKLIYRYIAHLNILEANNPEIIKDYYEFI